MIILSYENSLCVNCIVTVYFAQKQDDSETCLFVALKIRQLHSYTNISFIK